MINVLLKIRAVDARERVSSSDISSEEDRGSLQLPEPLPTDIRQTLPAKEQERSANSATSLQSCLKPSPPSVVPVTRANDLFN